MRLFVAIGAGTVFLAVGCLRAATKPDNKKRKSKTEVATRYIDCSRADLSVFKEEEREWALCDATATITSNISRHPQICLYGCLSVSPVDGFFATNPLYNALTSYLRDASPMVEPSQCGINPLFYLNDLGMKPRLCEMNEERSMVVYECAHSTSVGIKRRSVVQCRLTYGAAWKA